MKRSAIVRIVLFSIAILILGSILAGGILVYSVATKTDWNGLFEMANDFIANKDGTISSSGEADPKLIQNIEINWTSGSVIIQKGNVANITFTESDVQSDKQKMVWSTKGSTLRIDCSQYEIVIGISPAKDLVLTVPMDWSCAELELHVVDADIILRDLTAEDVFIGAVSGTCDFTGSCAINSLSIETVDGDIFYSGSLSKLDCEGVSADFRGEFTTTPARISIEGVSGNIDLILPADAGFTASLDTIDGRFTSDFETVTSGKYYTCGDGKCEIEIEGISGNVTITKAK
jgi:hypothetical protein